MNSNGEMQLACLKQRSLLTGSNGSSSAKVFPAWAEVKLKTKEINRAVANTPYLLTRDFKTKTGLTSMSHQPTASTNQMIYITNDNSHFHQLHNLELMITIMFSQVRKTVSKDHTVIFQFKINKKSKTI